MVNTYNSDLYGSDKTIMNEIIEFFKNEISCLSDFSSVPVYESTILLDENTPLPYIAIYRNPLGLAGEQCQDETVFEAVFDLMFFQEPSSRDYYEYLLYWFEEHIIKRIVFTTKMNYNCIPARIDNIFLVGSQIETAFDTTYTVKYANVSKVSYRVVFRIGDGEIRDEFQDIG